MTYRAHQPPAPPGAHACPTTQHSTRTWIEVQTSAAHCDLSGGDWSPLSCPCPPHSELGVPLQTGQRLAMWQAASPAWPPPWPGEVRERGRPSVREASGPCTGKHLQEKARGLRWGVCAADTVALAPRRHWKPAFSARLCCAAPPLTIPGSRTRPSHGLPFCRGGLGPDQASPWAQG